MPNATSAVGLVLDLDPDLGRGLREEEWEMARQDCRGKLLHLQPGTWSWAAPADVSDDVVGFLIVHGLLCREVSLRERHLFELLGPGDGLLPPIVARGPRLDRPIGLTALRETVLIELGVSFIASAARWPVVLTRWTRRLETQRQRVAIQALIAHIPRAEHRLLLVLWHIADRWGELTPAGTVLPVPLTHDLLGHLAVARRPTVTIAVASLQSSGAIRRLDDGSWLLTATAERMVDEIAPPGKVTHTIGEALMFRQRTADARAQRRAPSAEREQTRATRRARRNPPTTE